MRILQKLHVIINNEFSRYYEIGIAYLITQYNMNDENKAALGGENRGQRIYS